MKTLIIGSTGMLGNTAKKYFKNVETLDRAELDLTDCSYEELAVAIDSKRCDVVINCAGLIKQRSVTDAQMVAVNSLFPHRLAEICSLFGQKLFHITTDCVFSGLHGNYDELSPHDAKDLYGRSKSMGEPLRGCMVIRTSIIGEEEKNKLSFLEWVRSNAGGTIDGYIDHFWNGVTCLELCKTINGILRGDWYEEGTHHLFSETVNKYRLASIVNEVYDLGIKINPKSTQLCDRTLTTVKSNVFVVPKLQDQITQTRDFHNENIC